MQSTKRFWDNNYFPKWCTGCGTFGVDLCARCITKLPVIHFQRCVVCHRHSEYGITHKNCLATISHTPRYCYSLFHYQEIVRTMVRTAKFYPDIRLIPALLDCVPLSLHLELLTLMRSVIVDALVPIPSSPSLYLWRGYNPPDTIAQIISNWFSVPIAHIFQSSKKRILQSHTPLRKRDTAISGAFVIQKKTILQKRYLLIDDVVTTGATLREATKIVQKSGGEVVGWVTLCRSF